MRRTTAATCAALIAALGAGCATSGTSETKQADASWCLCQTLSVLNLAEPDEERFYNRMKSDTAAPAPRDRRSRRRASR